MRVLVDTNIVLDFLLEREPFVNDADSLFTAINWQQFEGFVAATTITNIFYIVRKGIQSIEKAREAVSRILTVMEICPVDSNILEMALASNLKDFEDAVQLACATSMNLEVIVTRDPQGFTGATIPILSVRELLEQLR